MSSEQRWRIHVKNMQTNICIGLHSHEQVPQRVLVNATIEMLGPTRPESIEDCFNYDHVRKLVVGEWPQRAHVFLLESYVTELLEHIFHIDPRVVYAKASVCKPDIFADTEAVGVEAEWTRVDFEQRVQL